MQTFPAQYSILSASALKTLVEQLYGFELSTCKLLLHGVSDVYVLQTTTATKYILKIYRSAHRSAEEVNGEIELLNLLHQSGCKIAPPIPDKQGGWVQAINASEGLRLGVVFTFAPGKATHELTDTHLLAIGREMAAIHNATAGISLQYTRKPYNTFTTVARPLQVLQQCFADYDKNTEYQWLADAAQQVVAQLQALDTGNFREGHCHYDYFSKNFFFDGEGDITIFDFDFAGKGFLVNDLASLHVYLFFRSMHKISADDIEVVFEKVITAYRQVRPLSDQELGAIPALGFNLLLFYLCFQYENFDDWSNAFFGPNYLTDRIGLMKKYKEQFCTP